jgi:hypothetical protein
VAKYLYELEVIWQLSQLKSGYDGELSFVTVCKMTIMTTNVTKEINYTCITTYYSWLQGSCNRNTFDDIKHQQNWYGLFFKVHNRNTDLIWKKGPPMLGLVNMFKAQYYTNVAKNEELVEGKYID